ncbi:50S ribosomal protein L32 [Candidatus Gottesmanbacteria bacterium]|nr:50S ribosomal protein L32 [Candidatus Gottesmanbacteria bacterium]
MTPLPKRKLSTRRQGKRRSHLKLSLAGLVKCPQCGTFRLSHRVCPNCGYYDGKQIVVKREKSKKK